MKTTIKTFIAIVALGIFGLANINATANNQSKVDVVSEVEKSLTIEPWMLENAYWNVKTEYNTAELEKALEVEAWMLADEKFLAQLQKEQKLEIEPWMTEVALFSSTESCSESVIACKSMKYIYLHRQIRHRN